MIDPKELTKMVERQIATSVDSQVLEVLTSDEWLTPLENKILQYTQDRILGRFANSSAVPELIDAIKTSVTELFAAGKIPGIEQYVDKVAIQQAVDHAVEQTVEDAIGTLGQDPIWLEKIERLINQAVVQRTLVGINSIDVSSVIRQRVDENMSKVKKELLDNFASTGIDDQATACQLTIFDDTTVVENKLTACDIDVVGGITVKDLAVTGSINTDNKSWNTLADHISNKTLDKLSEEWRDTLIQQVSEHIQESGINFEKVKIDGQYLVSGNTLSRNVTETSIQTTGVLRDLRVKGEAHIYDTVTVLKRRLGVNTLEPEAALSVWDEEVSVIMGKHKSNQAYVGTSRPQGLAIGVNRTPQIELGPDGITTIKKLKVGAHSISHGREVPLHNGILGDLVFNIDPGTTRIFAWICIGGYKWQTLKSAE